MSIETMKQALEALEEACGNRCNAEYNPCYARTAITSLRQAIEQAERREHEFVCGECVKCGASIEKREWVGLTNQERSECWETIPELAMKKVEAKLKEKNGYDQPV